jgi:hypothetical protein
MIKITDISQYNSNSTTPKYTRHNALNLIEGYWQNIKKNVNCQVEVKYNGIDGSISVEVDGQTELCRLTLYRPEYANRTDSQVLDVLLVKYLRKLSVNNDFFTSQCPKSLLDNISCLIDDFLKNNETFKVGP